MSAYTEAREEAATALLKKITEQVAESDSPKSIRALAEAFALVRGTLTGGPKGDVNS